MPSRGDEAGVSGELDPHAGRPQAVLRTDFKVLQINEYLGNRPEELDPRVGFPFVGRQSSIKTFRITGTPSDDGYLLLTYAFASDLVSRITVQPVRVALEAFLHHRLPSAPREAVA